MFQKVKQFFSNHKKVIIGAGAVVAAAGAAYAANNHYGWVEFGKVQCPDAEDVFTSTEDAVASLVNSIN